MARTPRNWDSMEAEIYRRLRETKGDSFWNDGTNDLLIDLFNERVDFWAMQIQQTYEGWGIELFVTDLVEDQEFYTMPIEGARLYRLFRIFEDTSEKPIQRYERPSFGLDRKFTLTGDSYMPTYRMIGRQIKLEPPPGSLIPNGLRIEMEVAQERIVNGESFLPADWPLFIESLMVMDTIVAAIDTEDQEDEESLAYTRTRRRRDEYAEMFTTYIDTRTRGIVTNEGHSLGA